MSKRDKIVKVISIVLFAFSIFIIYWYTLANREPKAEGEYRLELFWAVKNWINGVPTGKMNIVQYMNNILLFVPFGVLFPVKKRWYFTALAAMLISIIVELSQYIFALGLCEVDDVISNTLGAVIGYIIMMRINKCIKGLLKEY